MHKIINVKTKIDIKKNSNKKAELEISSKTNYGINTLLETIYTYLSSLEPKESSIITSERQILHSKALHALNRIKDYVLLKKQNLSPKN